MRKIIIILGLAVFLFSSCDKNLPDIEGTSAEKVSNEWWVELKYNNVDIYQIGHHKLLTYNTAANDGGIWVDDQKHGYGFKIKGNVNYADLSFVANTVDSNNVYYNPLTPASFPKTVKITEGRILPGVGRSRAGNVTDSIYMKIEFSDDPGTIFELKGHGRTKFIEDEY